MALYKFRNTVNSNTHEEPKGLGSIKTLNPVIAQTGGTSNNYGGTYSINRMNPVTDRLDEPSVVDDWIGKDAASIDKMYNLIYLRDSIAGPTIDLMSRLPWSDFILTGVKDPAHLKIFEDTCSALNLVPQLPAITAEYLTLGKQVASLLFDSTKGIWTGLIPHDPDMVLIKPRPIFGFDPKVDLKASPAMHEFILSQDERDLEAKKAIPAGLLQQLKSQGYIPLDPDNTLYIMRRSKPYDYIGTSYLTRVVPYWALEKALLSSTVIQARRRTRELLHISAGIDGVWEPTREELDYLTMLFIQADEDPNGGAVATRTGVNIDSVGSPTGNWKISDESDFLADGKMRALGINDAFLSGDATYANLEATLSVFIESLRVLREEITAAILYNKIFKTIAQVHELYERKPSEIAHRIRIKKKNEYQKLVIPKVIYNKQLRPEADSAYMDILDRAEEKGVPLTIKTWASAAGINLNAEMANIEEDTKLRAEIQALRGEGGGDDTEASIIGSTSIGGFKPIANTMIMARKDPQKALKSLPLWDKKKNFLQLGFNEACSVLSKVIDNKIWKKPETLRKKAIHACTYNTLDNNKRKTILMSYVLARCGFGLVFLDDKTRNDIALHLIKHNCGNVYMELRALHKLSQSGAEKTHSSQHERVENLIPQLSDPIPRDSPDLLAGLKTHRA